MAKYTDITVSASGAVTIVNNGIEAPFNVGQNIKMGLGSIELRKTQKAGLHVVRLSSGGHFKYSLKLNREGTFRLGPDHGYRVVAPEEEKDPIKKILREMNLPISKLRIMGAGETLEISTYSCDIHRAYPDGTETNEWKTDGKEQTEVDSFVDMRKVNQYCAPEVSAKGTIAGATYAVEVVQHAHNSNIGTYIGKIVVWPNCDPRMLANVLAPIVYDGKEADADYPEALKNFEAAQKWIAEKFKIEPHEEKGDALIVNGEEFRIGRREARYVTEPQTLNRLIGVHGIILVDQFLDEEQRSYLEALSSEEAAVQYVLRNYRVIAMKEGDKKFLHFAFKKGGRDPIADWMFRNSDTPGAEAFGELSKRHKSLEAILWVKAPERQELVEHFPCRFVTLKVINGIWGIVEDYRNEELKTPLVCEKDAVVLSLGDDEVKKNLVCLSALERYRGDRKKSVWGGNFLEGGLHSALKDGAEAFVGYHSAILPIKVGETKNFVFLIRHEWMSNKSSVWGITVSRTEIGVYEPYDNGKIYTCKGLCGSEVSAVSLAP